MSDPNSQPIARVTLQMLYEKQLENERLLIKLNEKLANMEDLPMRVNRIEIAQARAQWLEKIVYFALASGITGFVTSVFNMLSL